MHGRFTHPAPVPSAGHTGASSPATDVVAVDVTALERGMRRPELMEDEWALRSYVVRVFRPHACNPERIWCIGQIWMLYGPLAFRPSRGILEPDPSWGAREN